MSAEGDMARSDVDLDAEDEDSLERLVARIKRRGQGRALPAPDPAGVAAFLAHVADEVPMTKEVYHECERLWHAVDEVIEALDNTPA